MSGTRGSRATMGRRDFLRAVGGGAVTLLAGPLLPGCGGGGGGGGGISNGASRTQPLGDVKNQVNQFSTIVESAGLTWTAPSQAMLDMDQFLKSRGRADAPPETFFEATHLGLKALRGVQEMFALQILKLDDMGQLGEQVAVQNNVSGDIPLRDPLWIGGMMYTQHAGMVMVATGIETLQTNGLGQFVTQAEAETDDNTFLVTYAVIADIFNSFVEKQAAAVQMAVDPAWRLDDSETQTAAGARQELGRIEDILDRIPFGPGYASRQMLTRAGGPNPIPVPDDEIPSLIGEFVQKIVEAIGSGQSKDQVIKTITDTAGDYSKRLFINPTGLMKSLGKTLGKDIVKEIMKRVVVKWVKDRGGADAECAAKIMLDVYDLTRAIASVVGTLEVPPLAVVMAGLATIKVFALLQDIEDCTKKAHTPRLTGRIEKIEKRRKPYKGRIGPIGPIATDRIPSNQRIPDKTEKKRRRCARVRVKEQVHGQIINYPRSQPSGPVIEPMMATAGKYNADQFRNTMYTTTEVSGQLLPPGRGWLGRAEVILPRTHENMETSSAMLLYDLANRNQDVMQPSLGTGTLDFTVANYAALFTLEPGTETFQVPPISDAAVAVTAQDFVPQKQDSVDLSHDGQLPALLDLTNVSPGVLIHAK